MKPANFSAVYCAIYPALAEIARKHGYALAVHGSMARDFDLICVPWRAELDGSMAVVNEIVASFADCRLIKTPDGADFEMRNHGRMAYTISLGFAQCSLDLSFFALTR